MNVAPYRKLIVALAGAVGVAVSDGVLDLNDGITIALAALTAIGVYAFPNDTRPPLDAPEA